MTSQKICTGKTIYWKKTHLEFKIPRETYPEWDKYSLGKYE